MSKTKKWILKKRYTQTQWAKSRELLRSAISFTRKHWFIPRKVNTDGVNLAYGPRSGILFLSDTNEELLTTTPLEKLKLVFTYGDLEEIGSLLSIFIPYIDKKLGPDLLTTHIKKNEAMNFAEEYGYVYVVDASKNSNLICVPNSRFNSRNKKFMQSVNRDFYYVANIPVFYMLASSLKPEFIVGAFATQYLAFSLNISEETLIINQNYVGDVAAIKNKLKVNNSKAFQDCVLQASNYTDAMIKYESGATSLNNRFLIAQNVMKQMETIGGIEKVVHVFPKIKRIIDCTPFTSSQLNAIYRVLMKSKEAANAVRNEAVACLQFERGFYETQCNISSLPELVRCEIYSYVYPIVQENNSIYKKAKRNFLEGITSNPCFFSKNYQREASQVKRTKEQQPKVENEINFVEPSINVL